MSSGGHPFREGTRVEIAKLGEGTVRFVGQTSFAPGVWVGVCLDAANGKNDGSVHGKAYFGDTPPDHGVFVRPSQIHIVSGGVEEEEEEKMQESLMDEEELMPPPPVPASPRTAPRPAVGLPRRSMSPVKATPARTLATPSTAARPRSSLAAPGSSAAASSRPPSSATRSGSPLKPSLPRPSVSTPSTRPGGVAVARSPTKPTPGRTTPATRPTSSLSTGVRTTAAPARTTATARVAPRNTPAPAAAAATRTPASALKARAAVAATPSTPGAARAALRPVPSARPSMRPTPQAPPVTRTPSTRTTPPSTSSPATRAPTTSRTASSRSAVSVRSDDLIEPSTPGLRKEAVARAASRQSRAESDILSDRGLPPLEDEDLMKDSLEDDPEFVAATNEAEQAMDGGPDSPSLGRMSLDNKHRQQRALLDTETTKELMELRKKVTILERQRDEEREKVRDLSKFKEEAEKFLSQKSKMTERLQDVDQDLRNYEKMEKDWIMQKDQFDAQLVDLQEQLEMATMDKEIAEEKSENIQEELDMVRDKLEVAQIDLAVFQEQAAAQREEEEEQIDTGAAEAREKGEVSSAVVIQLERQNERLREALIKYRDVVSESDAEQKRKISEMDKELGLLSGIQAQYESASVRLQDAENLVEELKLQLDDALTAEEMLEELTDRNLSLSEKVEDMRAIIEDLEALKELNDELEETHIETEKQLQEEVDFKDMQLREQRSRTEILDANIADYENTFAQFRELIMNLQGDLESLRAQRAEESRGRDAGTDLSSQSQAMLNLNMKLQSSVLKSQAKTIDLELGKMAASQARVQLDIIRPYLPNAFFEDDADAVDSLLFFQRIGHKAEIIRTIVESSHDIQNQLVAGANESLIGVCQMRHSLAHFSALSRQIAAVISRGTPETFVKAGRMFKELISVEKRVDMYVEALRKEELKETECASDMHRFIRQLEEFSYALGEDAGDADLSAKEVGSAMLFEHDLDTLYAALGFTKQTLANLHVDAGIEWELAGKNVDDAIFGPLQQLIDHLRAAKVPARKLLRRLEILYGNDQAVKMEAIFTLPGLGQTSSQLVGFATQLASKTAAYAHEVRTARMPFLLSTFYRLVTDATKDGLATVEAEAWTTPTVWTSQLASTVTLLFNAALDAENTIQVTGDGPWIGRVEAVKADASRNVDAERQIAKLSDEAKDLFREVRLREERLQEEGIKVERLTRQLKASKEQADQIVSLRHELGETQKQSKAYQEANETMQSDIDNLEKAVVRLQKQVTSSNPDQSEVPKVDGFSTLTGGNVESTYLIEQVNSLRSAVRYLSSQNAYLKSAGLMRDFAELPPLLAPEPKTKEVGMPVQRGQDDADVSDLQTALLRIRTLRSRALRVAATPKIPDIAFRTARKWTPMALSPAHQYAQQKHAMREIQSDVARLSERLPALVGGYA